MMDVEHLSQQPAFRLAADDLKGVSNHVQKWPAIGGGHKMLC